MSNSQVVFALAKVLIATAWSDGKITQEETHSLQDLLFRLPKINGNNWAKLEIYLETPVSDEERKRLIDELRQLISSPTEKQLAIQTLQEMVEADGVLSESEKLVVQEVHTALEETGGSAFHNFGNFLKNIMKGRTEKLSTAPNRELEFEDFVKNKIYYQIQQILKESGRNLEIPENDLRKLCLAGGLMARIARKDKIVTKEESASIIEAFKKHWKVDENVAHFVTEVALSDTCEKLDYYRLTREFYSLSSEEERKNFIDILFDVARSDGQASHEETEEIRNICESLKLDRNQFILAKTNK